MTKNYREASIQPGNHCSRIFGRNQTDSVWPAAKVRSLTMKKKLTAPEMLIWMTLVNVFGDIALALIEKLF